ncbi:hypothetical protein TNCV_1230361 [Trichonephila clavipes]|nr:hypothetical protein TNCV_1230361 [Trichonephila clavipes]
MAQSWEVHLPRPTPNNPIDKSMDPKRRAWWHEKGQKERRYNGSNGTHYFVGVQTSSSQCNWATMDSLFNPPM